MPTLSHIAIAAGVYIANLPLAYAAAHDVYWGTDKAIQRKRLKFVLFWPLALAVIWVAGAAILVLDLLDTAAEKLMNRVPTKLRPWLVRYRRWYFSL